MLSAENNPVPRAGSEHSGIAPAPRSARQHLKIADAPASTDTASIGKLEHSRSRSWHIKDLFDPTFWERHDGAARGLATRFFSVFAGERVAWIVASGVSFSARIAASALLPYLTDSRIAMGIGVYAVGVLVNWPITYRLLRWQDERECRTPEGRFDMNAYNERAARRLSFLPKQEIGAFVAYATCSIPILGATIVWPSFFGVVTGLAMSVAPVVLQGFLVKYYDTLFSQPRVTLRKIWRELREPRS